MARTFIRQDAQIGSTLDTLIGFDDLQALAATMETAPGTIADDLNNIRSILHAHVNAQTGKWHDPLLAPTALEAGAIRGINDLNAALHLLEKRRVLRNVHSVVDVPVPLSQDFVVLAANQLPTTTTVAVGAVTTLGTVAAAHGGTFASHSLAEVAGTSAIAPLNLMAIVDGDTRDPILSGARKVYGLLQSEDATDGHTATGATPNRLQISFVRINATGDGLEAVPAADIEGQTINFCTRERIREEDRGEADFLGGAIVDVPAGSAVNRQVAFDSQGVTPVDLTTNATVDLEGPGLTYAVRDDLEALLWSIVEGSATGTSQFNIHAGVDEFDVDAAVNDFANGATLNSSGTAPVAVGVTDGVVETTAGDMTIKGAGELYFDDGNQDGSSWAQTSGLKLTETTQEWDDLETAFGSELSLAAMLIDAKNSSARTRVDATLIANAAAGADVNGPGTAHANTDADLLPYDVATVQSLEVFFNGELLRLADDYVAGGTPAEGDLQFTFPLKGTGSKPDQITVFRNGAN